MVILGDFYRLVSAFILISKNSGSFARLEVDKCTLKLEINFIRE